MKLLRFSCVVLLGLAACSTAPMEPAAREAGPSFSVESSDGGNGLGSGNFYDDGGTDGEGFTSTTEAAAADSTGREPNMIGSGN